MSALERVPPPKQAHTDERPSDRDPRGCQTEGERRNDHADADQYHDEPESLIEGSLHGLEPPDEAPHPPFESVPAWLCRPSLPQPPSAPKSKEHSETEAQLERGDVPLVDKLPELQEVVRRWFPVADRGHGVDDTEVDQPQDDKQDNEST